MEVLEWYPADAGGDALSVADFLKIGDDRSESDWTSRILSDDVIKRFASSKGPLSAKLNASPEQNRFPVIIYAPSLSASPIENVDLCEFLASQGYVVFASPSMGQNSRLMTDDEDGVKAQARDISFLIDYAKGRPNTDMDAVAVVGYSWGGLSNIYAATQDRRIKALVCLDGSIRYYVNVGWNVGIRPEQMTQPLLLFTQGYIPLESDLVNGLIVKGRPSLLPFWKHGDVYTIELAAMEHTAFASMNIRDSGYSEEDLALPGYDRDEVKASFGAVEKYALAFLNFYLRHDAGGQSFLKQAPTANGFPKHLVYASIRPATGLAPTLAELKAELEKRGFDDGAQVLSDAQTADSAFTIDEKALLAWAHGDLLD